MRLPVPYHEQHADYTCGPAALQMVFEYFGYMAPQHTLAAQAETNSEDGTTTADMIKTATEHGFFCFVNDNSSLHEVFCRSSCASSSRARTRTTMRSSPASRVHPSF